eukprot:6219031-Heterocapsa_arctica.AAC.1
MDRSVLGPAEAQVGAQVRRHSYDRVLRDDPRRIPLGLGGLLGGNRLRNTAAVLPRAAEPQRR